MKNDPTTNPFIVSMLAMLKGIFSDWKAITFSIIIITVCLGIAALKGRLKKKRRQKEENRHPENAKYINTQLSEPNEIQPQSIKYQEKFHLLGYTEQALFSRLNEVVNKDNQGEFYVFSQVSMTQLFYFRNRRFEPGFNEVARKSIDFVICGKNDMRIFLAVELNGPHHEEKEQKARDSVKKQALESAGIPLLVYKPERLPSIEQLIDDMVPLIQKKLKKIGERNKE
ncbi:MAG: DUF2726 domain-containing protein [Candidatus Accumulibacter sp.]|jgi:very-short-patch-repair endonuclease|nr:DUF2726 domain-containing protein [Accumulibacter sp.]